MQKALIFILLLLSSSLHAQALRKDVLGKTISKDLEDQVRDPEINKRTRAFDNALEEQQRIMYDPDARAKLRGERRFETQNCIGCPPYMNLIKNVNEAIDKIKIDSVADDNRRVINVSKLNFMYYVAKAQNEDGSVSCNQQSKMDFFDLKEFKNGQMNLMAEKALALPDISEVQFYDKNSDEIHYYYRGTGSEKNIVVEVIMYKSKPAIMRYYEYKDRLSLPELDGSDAPKDKDNFVTIQPKVKTQNAVLSDLEFGKLGKKINLAEDLNLRATGEGSYNQQKGVVSFENEAGEKHVVIEGTNVTDGKKSVNTIINYNFNLDQESKLDLQTSAETKLETSTDPKKIIDRTNAVSLSLTDHDSEYFKVRGVIDDKGPQSIGLGNSVRLGEGKAGVDYSIDRDGNHAIGAKLSEYGMLKETGVKYTNGAGRDNEKWSSYAKTDLALDTSIKFETSYSKVDKFGAGLAVEKRIAQDTTLVLSGSKNQEQGYNFMFQFSTKF